MEPNEIRDLIELISRSEFSEFELERDGFKLKLVRQQAVTQVVAAPTVPAASNAAAVDSPAGVATVPAAMPSAAAADDGVVDFNSPIIGTFYRSPGPDSPPFVEIGGKVSKGQTMCIVEAMKVMNEIEAEFDAEVVDAPVANGQPVEYGEVLFRLRPLG